ncbi:MAG: HDIG domain-containing protein [Caldisericia bacterium]
MSLFYPGFSFVLRAGNVAPHVIVSPKDASITDEDATKSAQNEAAEKVDTVYKKISSVTKHSENSFGQLFPIIEIVNYESDEDFVTDKERADRIKLRMSENPDLNIKLKDQTLLTFAGLNRLEFNEIKDTIQTIVSDIMDEGVTQERFESRDKSLDFALKQSDIPSIYLESMLEVCIQLVEVNLQEDIEATKKAREDARNQVTPIMKEIKENQILIDEGEIISSEDIETIEKLGISSRVDDPRKWAIIFVLPFIVILGLYFLLFWFDPKIFTDNQKITLFTTIITVFIISSRFLVPINPFLVPIPFIAFIMSIFLGTKISIPTLLFLAPIMAIYSRVGFTESYGIIALIIGYGVLALLTCLHLDRVKRFSDFFLVAGYSMLGAVILFVFYWLFTTELTHIFVMGGYAIFSTAVQIALGFGFTPLLERITNESTVFHLLELSDLNSPLMKRLMLEAPGTYQHSLLVGNISSAACEAIGANSLLARVGGYYHDIGKLKHPEFFIENQTGANPHEEITPTMSTLIITKHIKEGLDIANNFGLPPEVTNFISSHHGTTVVQFFYMKAKETDPLCRKTDFRYKGEKPKTIEEAIVMIADAAESAARARKPERSKIEDLVDSIIKDRINDEQLSDCPISLDELSKVKIALTNQIASTRHERVPYPTDKELKE